MTHVEKLFSENYEFGKILKEKKKNYNINAVFYFKQIADSLKLTKHLSLWNSVNVSMPISGQCCTSKLSEIIRKLDF